MRRRFLTEKGIVTNALLLLHFDDNYTDYSPYKRIPMNVNSINYATGKFGNCLYISSLTNYIQYDRTWFVDLFNTGVYTIDFWAIMSNHWSHFLGIDDGTIDGFVCRISQTQYFEYGIYNNLMININVSEYNDNLFHHFAIVSNGSQLFLYIDGRLKTSALIKSVLFPSAQFTLGGRVTNTSGVAVNNYLDELCISRVARWKSNFIPPTKPY